MFVFGHGQVALLLPLAAFRDFAGRQRIALSGSSDRMVVDAETGTKRERRDGWAVEAEGSGPQQRNHPTRLLNLRQTALGAKAVFRTGKDGHKKSFFKTTSSIQMCHRSITSWLQQSSKNILRSEDGNPQNRK